MHWLRRVTLAVGLLALAGAAQTLDVAAGLGTAAGGRISGGIWPSGSATVMFWPNVGLETDFAMRADAKSFGVDTSHPYLASLNLAFRPHATSWTPEFDFGAALEGHQTSPGCVGVFGPGFPPPPACPVQPNFYGAHVGVSLQHYVSARTFLRFEYHQYIGRRFNLYRPARFAVSLGYTFGRVR